MTMVDTTQVREALGFSAAQLATCLGVSVRSVERWERGQTYPQHAERCKLAALDALVRHLRATFAEPTDITTWLNHDHPYFGGLRPYEVLLAGRPDRVEAALVALDSGVFI